jgi:Holliday junction resolvase RusA-like endonuclease
VAKIIADALNGLAWRDDSQVVSLHVSKQYAEEPMVSVMMEEV